MRLPLQCDWARASAASQRQGRAYAGLLLPRKRHLALADGTATSTTTFTAATPAFCTLSFAAGAAGTFAFLGRGGHRASHASSKSDPRQRRMAAGAGRVDTIFELGVADLGRRWQGTCCVRHVVRGIGRACEDVAEPVAISLRLEVASEAAPLSQHDVSVGRVANNGGEGGRVFDGRL